MSQLTELLALSTQALPPDEERDVNSSLFRTLFQGIQRNEFVQADEMNQWLTELHQADTTFRKGIRLEETLRPLGPHVRTGRTDSYLYAHELGLLGAGVEAWAEKPTPGGGFEFLSYLHDNLDIHQALVYARCHQVEPYCRRYSDDDDNPLGYRWVRRDNERMSDADNRTIRKLDDLLRNSGTEKDQNKARWKLDRVPFDSFVKQIIASTLVADSAPIALTRQAGDGSLLGWNTLDYRTIRLAYEDGYRNDDKIVAVQINPETRGAVLGYTQEEILFPVRNPRASIYYGGYGRAELEAFTRAATAYLNSFTFNAAQQDRNSLPRGFLTLYGRFDQRALNSFREQWNQLVRGAARRWALPVLVSESRQEGGAMYTPVDTAISEMYLTKWITFLVSLMCALYGMDPVELAMESFTSKQSSLSGKDTAEKLQSSRDRGFIPLMLWLQNHLNSDLIAQYTQRYLLTWVGLFPEDTVARQEREQLVLTVDEMRSKDGVGPHPDPDIGTAPVNPVHMQIHSLKMQQRMMGGMAAGYGDDGGHGLPDSEAPLGDYYGAGGGNEGPPGQPGQKALPAPPGKLALPAPGQAPMQAGSAKPGVKPPMPPMPGKPPMQKARTLTVTIQRLG